MIRRIIAASVRWPYRVLSAVLVISALSILSLRTMPLDALPEVTDPQVIIEIIWEAPTERIDREVAEPVSNALMAVPGVRTVRTMTEMGYGFVYAILSDGAQPGQIRQEISNRLAAIAPLLPGDALVRLGPDASSVGWVYQYALVDPTNRRDLRQLHDLQSRRVAPILESIPGVAEVATVGGLKCQIQIHVYPPLLAQYRLPLGTVLSAIRDAFADAGGRMVEVSGRDFQIRAVAPVRTLDDVENAVVGLDNQKRPVRVRDIGFVQVGYDLRRGIADLDGTGEVVGGIVVMSQGENAIRVLAQLKQKIAEARAVLPDGVKWITVYDRSDLVREALTKMGMTLTEELIAVALICLVFLAHLRSALVPILVLPVVCLMSLLFMRLFGGSLHLPVLAGIAIALGEIVDAVLVMVENAHRRMAGGASDADRATLTEALVQVGRPLFFSLSIILFSFMPIFLLEAQEGRLFRPMAVAKTFAMLSSVLLSITLGPALIAVLLGGGRIPSEEQTPVTRWLHALYAPAFRWALSHRTIVIALNMLMLLAIPFWWRLEKSFMPPLEEGSILYMPTTVPGLPLREAGWILQKQDAVLREVPEVAAVFGKAGRAETPTDPAPISMIETTLTLKPKSDWRPGMTHDRLIAELDRRMQFPGWINAWTQPIRGRMDMLATGIRTEVGVLLYSDDFEEIAAAAGQTEKIMREMRGVRNVYAERPTLGYFLDIRFDRTALSRAGLTEREATDYARVAMAGAEVSRFRGAVWDTGEFAGVDAPVTVLCARDYVDEIHKIEELPVVLPGGSAVPLSSLGTVRLQSAPASIRRERGRWVGYVHADVDEARSGRVVGEAKAKLAGAAFPGVGHELVGQFQYRERAFKRLLVVVPLVLVVIFLLLKQAFGSMMEAFMLMLSVPAAMAGGILSQAIAGYPTTVAVLVGYIALYAVAVQTGIVMVVYLKEACDRKIEQSRRGATDGAVPGSIQDGSFAGGRGGYAVAMTESDLEAAVYDGSVQRLRPKLMTVATTILGFVPILWSEGPGAEMLRHIAVPMMGGMLTSTLHVLFLTPILFFSLNRKKLKATLRSGWY